MKKILTVIFTLGLITAAFTAQCADMKGTILYNKMGDAVIHTYVSPEKGGRVTSHVIEGPTKLVIIDAHFFYPFRQGASRVR
jgi:hypothetical protein